MKFKIAYLPEEEQEAAADLAALLSRHPGAKVHRSDVHPPFKHIYLTTKKPGKPTGARETLDRIPPVVV